MKTTHGLLALATILLFLTGCPSEGYDPQISLYPLTGAPPTKVAQLDNSHETLRTINLSAGVSLGVSCYSYCEEVTTTDACEGVTVTADHDEVLRVDEIYSAGASSHRFVLSGTAVGTTNVTVTTLCGSRKYLTTVSE